MKGKWFILIFCYASRRLVSTGECLTDCVLTLTPFPPPCSMTYEDPQALGGLASALDVRQQNTAGVSRGTKHAGRCSLCIWGYSGKSRISVVYWHFRCQNVFGILVVGFSAWDVRAVNWPPISTHDLRTQTQAPANFSGGCEWFQFLQSLLIQHGSWKWTLNYSESLFVLRESSSLAGLVLLLFFPQTSWSFSLQPSVKFLSSCHWDRHVAHSI